MSSVRDVRVLVVDDHRAFAEALQHVIAATPGAECVGAARTGEEAIELARSLRPDVVLLDLQLPGMSGTSVTAKLRAQDPGLRVIILTANASVEALVATATAGATGFLPKEAPLSDILSAIQRPGDTLLIDGPTLAHLVDRLQRGTDDAHDLGLTAREVEVLDALAHGFDPKQIARHLGITVSTCRSYIKSVLAKLGAHSQLEAVVIAARKGLLHNLSWRGDDGPR